MSVEAMRDSMVSVAPQHSVPHLPAQVLAKILVPRAAASMSLGRAQAPAAYR